MPNESPLDVYLDAIHRIRSTRAGTAETSYYPAVGQLLNIIGNGLRPHVFCLHHPSGSAGIPDFGLFEQAQFRRNDSPEWTGAVNPDRGVVEVKGASHRMATLLAGKQMREQYLPQYGLVLATNLWQFRLVGAGNVVVESFDISPNEADFWALAAGSRPDTLRERLQAFLTRCLLTRAPLRRPSDVAFFLASYAREAMAQLGERAELPALANLRHGMEEALGIRFEGRDGEHLFRSTLVQTLFYGLFSAWVVHARAGQQNFNWRASTWSLQVPVMRFLFGQIATPEALGPLNIVPLLDGASAALERVERPAFFAAFSDALAVQYFYEPFLKYFDPELRRQLGVWYTPPEIVRYQVERVDRVLREELGVADGLADPDVWVLDPCCGTGSYLVAVLDRIKQTLAARGIGDLVAEELKRAAMTRIVGFEIMTAPMVIAHWQVSEMLRDAPLNPGERAAIYLTNALTGWDEGEAGPLVPGFEALTAERGAATSVKRDRPVLVVIGNPPYNAYAGVSPMSEGGLVEPYKVGLRTVWGLGRFNLDDLYVRFFRIAERKIAEGTGRGVVSYISNWSWLFLPSFVVMRERLLGGFDSMWLDCLNGDSRETGKRTPDGLPDPSIFSTEHSREGIRVGAAIATLVRHDGDHSREASVGFREFWGVQKRRDILASLDDQGAGYETVTASPANGYVLRPGLTRVGYAEWTALDTLIEAGPMPGMLEKRGGGLIDIDRDRLRTRMQSYLRPTATFEQACASNPALGTNRARYNARDARARLLETEGFNAANLRRYCIFSFDVRWAYVTAVRPTWNEPRPQLLHVLPDAAGFLVVRSQRIADPEGFPAAWCSCLADDYALHKHAFLIPVVSNLSGAPRPNLSAAAIEYLASLGLDASIATATLLFHHILATLYAPLYLAENAGGLRQGWPRVSLPQSIDQLHHSAALGAQLAALLDADTPVPGVSTGAPTAELAQIAIPTTVSGQDRNWSLTGWGNRTMAGITMPQRGRVSERPYSDTEAHTSARQDTLGDRMQDIGISATSFWRGVPDAVWECRIGGYQVLKKWLSYRDHSIIARPLSADEIAHFQQSARRIAAILMLGLTLDASYRACVLQPPDEADHPR